MAETVNRRSVNPINAKLEGPMNRGDGFAVVLRSPRELPVRAANSPRSVTYRCDLKIRTAQLFGLHCDPPDKIWIHSRLARIPVSHECRCPSRILHVVCGRHRKPAMGRRPVL